MNQRKQHRHAKIPRILSFRMEVVKIFRLVAPDVCLQNCTVS